MIPVFLVKNEDKTRYKKLLSFDDNIVYFQNEEYSVIAACYEPLDYIYRWIKKKFPDEFVVNNMLTIGAIG